MLNSLDLQTVHGVTHPVNTATVEPADPEPEPTTNLYRAETAKRLVDNNRLGPPKTRTKAHVCSG